MLYIVLVFSPSGRVCVAFSRFNGTFGHRGCLDSFRENPSSCHLLFHKNHGEGVYYFARPFFDFGFGVTRAVLRFVDVPNFGFGHISYNLRLRAVYSNVPFNYDMTQNPELCVVLSV